jgi:hypothetical protein
MCFLSGTDCICMFRTVLTTNSDISPKTSLTGWALLDNVFPVGYEHYLCVPYGSHNKQRLFPHAALTGWAL